ncbi:MAG TPA: HAMP domain-containing sensor histidine kinase [Flavipsychrobacter sp.]|nr:HAMP domain-containing sensor histidine kinase [Flavipsychrobacter sp.]
MQIRYRITLVYSTIVTVILLLLCSSIYFFSVQNRTSQFYSRLMRKSLSTADLLWRFHMQPDLVTDINETSPSALINKGIIIYDADFRPLFSFYDEAKDSIKVGENILHRLKTETRFFFTDGERDAVALQHTINGRKYHIITAAYDGDKAEWLPKLRLILTVSFIVSLSIVVVSGYVFSLGLVRSISDFTNKINHISSEQFSQRLATGTEKDELQKLAATINNLLDRLKSSFDTQRRFIDNASHELSTPLASVGSQIDVALQRERSGEEYRSVLASIHEDTNRLNLLVRSLLEIAKVSGSAKGIELSPIRVDELLMRLPSEMRKANAGYDVKLVFSDLPDDEDKLTVYGNDELLFSAIKNVVLNACKFSVDKTAMVSLQYNDGELKIAVEDKGPGIAIEEQELIFRHFYRSAETNSLVGGSGLGLPLANQIIKLYDGRIELFSQKGVGSVFNIFLKTVSANSKNAPTSSSNVA